MDLDVFKKRRPTIDVLQGAQPEQPPNLPNPQTPHTHRRYPQRQTRAPQK